METAIFNNLFQGGPLTLQNQIYLSLYPEAIDVYERKWHLPPTGTLGGLRANFSLFYDHTPNAGGVHERFLVAFLNGHADEALKLYEQSTDILGKILDGKRRNFIMEQLIFVHYRIGGVSMRNKYRILSVLIREAVYRQALMSSGHKDTSYSIDPRLRDLIFHNLSDSVINVEMFYGTIITGDQEAISKLDMGLNFDPIEACVCAARIGDISLFDAFVTNVFPEDYLRFYTRSLEVAPPVMFRHIVETVKLEDDYFHMAKRNIEAAITNGDPKVIKLVKADYDNYIKIYPWADIKTHFAIFTQASVEEMERTLEQKIFEKQTDVHMSLLWGREIDVLYVLSRKPNAILAVDLNYVLNPQRHALLIKFRNQFYPSNSPN